MQGYACVNRLGHVIIYWCLLREIFYLMMHPFIFFQEYENNLFLQCEKCRMMVSFFSLIWPTYSVQYAFLGFSSLLFLYFYCSFVSEDSFTFQVDIMCCFGRSYCLILIPSILGLFYLVLIQFVQFSVFLFNHFWNYCHFLPEEKPFCSFFLVLLSFNCVVVALWSILLSERLFIVSGLGTCQILVNIDHIKK